MLFQANDDLPLAIVKLFYARNNPDAAEKKQVLSAADVIGGIMIKHLKQDMMGGLDAYYRMYYLTPSVGETSHGLDYFSVMLGLMTVLLVDGMYSLPLKLVIL